VNNQLHPILDPPRTIITGGSHTDDVAVCSGQVTIDLKLIALLYPGE
jgi:hypothetical protein